MQERVGSCLCGGIRYTITGEPDLVGVCHCRDCQKFTGSAFSFLVVVPEDAVTFEGKSKTFSIPGDSGKPIERQFCPECGSSIAERAFTRPGAILINGGTLDDPTSVKPAIQIYCDRELAWTNLDDSIQRFAEAPPN